MGYSGGDGGGVETLVETVRRLAGKLEDLPIRDGGNVGPDRDPDRLPAVVVELLGEALACCTRVFGLYFARCDFRAEESDGNVSRRLDALVAGDDIAAHIADIAFMGCWEIKQKLAILTEPEGAEPAELLGHCASARRRTIKALCAVEMAVCDCEQWTSELRSMYRTELDCALAVRRAFAEFRQAVAHATVARDTTRGRMRGIGVAVARLIGSDGYLFTRAEDRALVDDLQQRILAWLRSDGESTDETPAAEIDLFADHVVERLRGVNRRVELREHDRRLSKAVLQSFLDDETATTLPAAVLEKLRSLRGRDDEIDGLLAQGAQSAEPWRRALAQVVQPDPEPSCSTSREIYLRGLGRRRAVS